ncbi:hypothetical protein C7E25_25015, partial [Stenotrophomonas maltophilia]
MLRWPRYARTISTTPPSTATTIAIAACTTIAIRCTIRTCCGGHGTLARSVQHHHLQLQRSLSRRVQRS